MGLKIVSRDKPNFRTDNAEMIVAAGWVSSTHSVDLPTLACNEDVFVSINEHSCVLGYDFTLSDKESCTTVHIHPDFCLPLELCVSYTVRRYVLDKEQRKKLIKEAFGFTDAEIEELGASE